MAMGGTVTPPARVVNGVVISWSGMMVIERATMLFGIINPRATTAVSELPTGVAELQVTVRVTTPLVPRACVDTVVPNWAICVLAELTCNTCTL
jgi:hypothetical protein